MTCASSLVVVALVVLGLCLFASDQLAAQARIRRLLPVVALVTSRPASAGHQIVFRRQSFDQVDCRVRHHDLCLRVVPCLAKHLQM